jgi:hypothetical protein
MRRRISIMTSIADRIGRFRWQTGGTTYFHLELATRHRAYLAPSRLLLKATTIGLIVWACWSMAEALFAFQGLHETEARLHQARLQDQQLIDEARAAGIDRAIHPAPAQQPAHTPERRRYDRHRATVFPPAYPGDDRSARGPAASRAFRTR